MTDHQDSRPRGLTPYVDRDEHDSVVRSLSEAPFTLLLGEAKAGKSRTAFEAALQACPDRPVVVPAGASPLTDLLALDDPSFDFEGALIWLDDLNRYFEGDALLGLKRVMEGPGDPPRLLATIRTGAYDTYASGSSLYQHVSAFLLGARRIRLHPITDVEAVESTLEGVGASFLKSVERYGLGASLVGGPTLVDKFEARVDPHGYAIVRAAADWARAGMARPIDKVELYELYSNYVEHAAPSEAAFLRGLEWARKPLEWETTDYEMYPLALLIGAGRRGTESAYRALDYIVEHVERRFGGTVPASTWEVVTSIASDEELLYVATAAKSLAAMSDVMADKEVNWAAARRALEQLVASNDEPLIKTSLGYLFEQQEEMEGAEEWYRKAAEAGEWIAMKNLGGVLARRGDEDEAERWLRSAASTEPVAGASLGMLLWRRGDVVQAERWLRTASEAGDTGAMTALGHLLEERGDTNDAEDWHRRAAQAGDPRAMTNLGRLLVQRGNPEESDEALRWTEDAARMGELVAMTNFGVMLRMQGKTDEGERWIRDAAMAGHVDAMTNLGVILQEQGDIAAAGTWYRQAAETGDPIAMEYLAALLLGAGDQEGALYWSRRAANAGEVSPLREPNGRPQDH